MFIAGLLCITAAAAYYLLTQDTPEGNYRELRAAGKLPPPRDNKGAFWQAARDYRVWALLAIYGACFGIELSLNNVAVLYLVDYFPELKAMEPAQALKTAGLVAGLVLVYRALVLVFPVLPEEAAVAPTVEEKRCAFEEIEPAC